MSAFAVPQAYAALLTKFPPQIIQTEAQNEAYINLLYEMDKDGSSDTPEGHEYAALLTLLVENYEEQHYAMPRATQSDAIEFLLDQHGADVISLASVEGLDGGITEVLEGKRELLASEIRALSKRFHVSPEVFF